MSGNLPGIAPYGTAAFLAGPLAFMAANVIMPNHNAFNDAVAALKAAGQGGELVSAVLKPHPQLVGRLGAAVIPVWSLLPRNPAADPANEAFLVYWCPYASNETHSIMLGNATPFMFTAQMDGCSFGIGSPGANGAQRVAHANTTGVAGMVQNAMRGDPTAGHVAQAEQRKTQRNMLWATINDANIHVINPNDYMIDFDGGRDLKGTTFGLLAPNGSWAFHTQRYYRPMGTTVMLRDVVRQY